MIKPGFFKSRALVDALNWLVLPMLGVYGLAMFAYPFYDGNGSWKHVQLVWDRWQTLNAATLAFFASVVAFNITRYAEERQREREFVAAKAFLPSTFSGLMRYLTDSARIYTSLWESNGRTDSELTHPPLPADYREVFSSCIRHGTPVVGSYLSRILSLLQVHDARLQRVVAASGTGQDRVIDRSNLMSYLYSMGELYALIGKQFEFARGSEDFDTTGLSWDDYRNAYGILRIHVEDIFIDTTANLEAFTRRAIERSKRG